MCLVRIFGEQGSDQLGLGPQLLVPHVDLLVLLLLLRDGLPSFVVVLVLPDLDGTLVRPLFVPGPGLDTQKIQSANAIKTISQ